jgi:hypothetical protein
MPITKSCCARTSNRSQGYLSQAVLRIWCSPPKASDRQSNTAPTTFGKRRRGVVERSQLAVGKEPDAGLLVRTPAWNRPGLFCGQPVRTESEDLEPAEAPSSLSHCTQQGRRGQNRLP